MQIKFNTLKSLSLEFMGSYPLNNKDINVGSNTSPLYKRTAHLLIDGNSSLSEKDYIYLQLASNEQLINWCKEFYSFNPEFVEAINKAINGIKIITHHIVTVENQVYL